MISRYLLLAALTSAALTTTSCLEKETETQKDKPFAASDVATELLNAWDYSSPSSDPVGTMAVGNFVYYDNTQQLETSAPRVYLQEGITIVNRTITTDPDNAANDLYKYFFAYQTVSYDGDVATPSTRQQERTASVPKPSPTPTPTPAALDSLAALKGADLDVKLMALSNSEQNKSLRALEEDLYMQLGYEKIVALPGYCVSSPELEQACQEQLGADTCSRSCSNLQSYTEVVDPPALIKAQPNCGGLANCKMTLKRIKFDSTFTVVKKGATQTQKIIYSIAVSPDLPFLARVYEFCQRGLFNYNSSKILLKNCTVLRDYQKEPTPAQ
ncbi:hypothetical protein D3C87_1321240 [compost metagenome]